MSKTGTVLLLAAITAIALGERRRPLRRTTRPVRPRIARNLVMGAMCAGVVLLAEAPATQAIARANVRDRRGLAGWLPGALGPVAAFVAMDYGFYRWHVATHRVPLLWRLHRVHHVDPDLDMSTALRFHFVDMAVSLPWQAAQVRLSGIGPRTLAAWKQFFLLSILFHHSNLRLPARWDAWASLVLTTPRMHGIHHSQCLAERESNWSSGLSLWDRLHGTFVAGVEPARILIGVDDAAAGADVALGRALAAPFA
ncbi:sterol desaturase [Polymorphobacter glacialis]|uniref:Sterol desaturase n=1 Tax=Sandarakinorhabdus glacialis TaxID=1614636 RepID=A0A916ZZW2_9SPHN|nr:sterol desaturase family protein [Polymorphobacter glacialis]GGE20320.1 sterol desaturase [Polymorphobacter glacialis]